MNHAYRFVLGLFAHIRIAAMAAVAYAYVAIERVFYEAFPASAAANAREAPPSLIVTETRRQTTSLAHARSFVTRRLARIHVGRGAGDPCSSLAFAA